MAEDAGHFVLQLRQQPGLVDEVLGRGGVEVVRQPEYGVVLAQVPEVNLGQPQSR
ncbi:hypothetical protein MUN84_11545 [Hymenobacter sp. 5516J-16]|uniref:hypothetical protein n=1 Tax=Hymenobacter sp. 5516J-16 TaxID=2932253 RepID=UPI001FD1CEBE|nr:hypothetical protein [Hymenobacter sp. 5516J-16]UOQ75363.1 hypothetical protein MUN84_11545 [Hymenobacter sp. 5516J-16]